MGLRTIPPEVHEHHPRRGDEIEPRTARLEARDEDDRLGRVGEFGDCLGSLLLAERAIESDKVELGGLERHAAEVEEAGKVAGPCQSTPPSRRGHT